MKRLIASIVMLICLVGFVGSSFADVYVRGHFRGHGTYVQPHYRSNPDGYLFNNRSYRGW
jgi:hypothetical protein